MRVRTGKPIYRIISILVLNFSIRPHTLQELICMYNLLPAESCSYKVVFMKLHHKLV
jgi:hypothetical protein